MLLQVLRNIFGRRSADAFPSDQRSVDRLLRSLSEAGKRDEAMALYDAAIASGLCACEPGFDEDYRRSLEATGTPPYGLHRRQRFQALVGLLAETLALQGDVAECGCYRGLSSHLMLTRLRRADPAYLGAGYHVFDSFQGLSEPQSVDREGRAPSGVNLAAQRGWFTASLESVRAGLGEFPEVSFHPGWIPQSFAGLAERTYRFVHLDVDLHEPTLGALEYFYPRMVPGAILVCDDFDWPGERKAIEDFCARLGLKFETTPHGQAVLRRH